MIGIAILTLLYLTMTTNVTAIIDKILISIALAKNSRPNEGERVSVLIISSLTGRLPVIRTVWSCFMFFWASCIAADLSTPDPLPEIEMSVDALPLSSEDICNVSTRTSSKYKSSFLLKKADDLDETFKEDLEFARRTEEAYQSHEAGDFKIKSSKEFLKELKE